ncbi:MAG: SUMF1/EgtB/PvdO family nonheme iron enzyme, partial [Candidatus Latescibacteria bacterium]|nr:SUMF1/EgtB/PvdO family nonheme iron enzyme [Candidatus Latescibacterota bacterium]
MKRAIILGLILLFTACEKDHSPTKPSISTTGTIKIVIADKSVTEASVTDSLNTVNKPAKTARLDQLEVRVLKSDNSVLASKTFAPSNGYFQVSMTVEAHNDLTVLCLGTIGGVVVYCGIDEHVNVQAGKTTTSTITGWNEPFVPEITGISPNPSTDGTYTVYWTQAPNTTIYVLQEAVNDKFGGATTAYTGNSLKYDISDKTSGKYYYRVQASNGFNVTSNWSATDSVVVQQSYTISGTIAAGSGASVTLSGDAYGSQITDGNGGYSFTVAHGGSYTITPSKTNYTISPESQTFNNVTTDITAHFTASSSLNTYTISGTVTGADGVTVTLSGDASDSQVVTTDGGSYSFAVNEGGNYTITPSKFGYTFEPVNQPFNSVTSDQNQNFTASEIPPNTYTITGIVSGADGVTITLSGDKSESIAINDGAAYSFTVDQGGNYTVTPSKTEYTFTPPSKDFTDVTSNLTQDFTASEIPSVQYTLTMAVNQTGWGTTTPSIGSHTYDEGSVVTITASPLFGYIFVNWTGNVADVNSATTTVTMNGNTTVTANFEESSTTPTEITMVSIAAGTFQMGSNGGEDDEKPVHTVTLDYSFEMSVYEITQGQYKSVIGTNPSGSFGVGDYYPVYNLHWYDAITFCNKLSDSAGLERCYNESTGACDFTKNGFRLP